MELEKIHVTVQDGRPNDGDDENYSADDKDLKRSPERETWGGKFEFTLSLIGYTVGFSNIWRFPYMCYRNGGGAFLIPFAIFLLLCGGPLYYLEVCAGQFSGKSTFNVWDICPLMRGVGVTMCIVSSLYIWSYAVIFAWIMYYLYNSFFPTLPWTTCDNDWNTAKCIDSAIAVSPNVTDVPYNVTYSFNGTGYTTPGWEFWEYKVLNKSSGIDHMGSVQWHLLVGLFLGWLLVFLCLVKGIQSLGKVVYVTVIGPYILLTILLVRGVTLDGAWDGLKLYLVPKFSRLATGQIWMEAAVQVFYSLGPAWGSIITMSSFNKFHNNALRDTVIVCCFDIFTAFYGGLVVFSVIGFLSKRTGSPIEELPFAGPALAFIVYPEALGQMPLSHFWSVLFFVTLVFIGIDSQFGTFEVLSNAVIDMNYEKFHKYRTYISASIVIGLFLLGIPLTCSNGLYIFRLTDWYMATFNILIVAILECIVFSWVYGASRFGRDIEAMLGKPPSFLVRIEWVVVAPLFLGAILMMNLVSYSPVEGEDGYQFPQYALSIGNVMAFGPLLAIFVGLFYQLYTACRSGKTKLGSLLAPNDRWKPNDPTTAEMYEANPYVYSRGLLRRVVKDVFGWKRTVDY